MPGSRWRCGNSPAVGRQVHHLGINQIAAFLEIAQLEAAGRTLPLGRADGFEVVFRLDPARRRVVLPHADPIQNHRFHFAVVTVVQVAEDRIAEVRMTARPALVVAGEIPLAIELEKRAVPVGDQPLLELRGGPLLDDDRAFACIGTVDRVAHRIEAAPGQVVFAPMLVQEGLVVGSTLAERPHRLADVDLAGPPPA